jgi:hypothetical protein
MTAGLDGGVKERRCSRIGLANPRSPVSICCNTDERRRYSVAGFAAYLPARRASTLEPVAALRAD